MARRRDARGRRRQPGRVGRDVRRPPPRRRVLAVGAGLAVYALFLVVPIASIALISLQNFEFYGGIQPGITLKNYREIFTDGSYWVVFGRTFWIALVVTALCAVLGTYEAIVLHRMANPWKIIFLGLQEGDSIVVETEGGAILEEGTKVVARVQETGPNPATPGSASGSRL